jgi:hypothetical protein
MIALCVLRSVAFVLAMKPADLRQLNYLVLVGVWTGRILLSQNFASALRGTLNN